MLEPNISIILTKINIQIVQIQTLYKIYALRIKLGTI